MSASAKGPPRSSAVLAPRSATTGRDTGERPWKVAKQRLVIRVRVTPKSSRDGVEGIEETTEGPAFKVRVRAVPEDGAANSAVGAVLAEWLGIPKRAVSLTTGAKSRVKSFDIDGDAARIEAVLADRLAELSKSTKEV